jgi:PAT family beta-lactamase induction signal transducer AmpG
MEIYKKQSLAETFSVYFDRRMIKILLLGAISGFPLGYHWKQFKSLVKRDGLSRSTIGWAGLIFRSLCF